MRESKISNVTTANYICLESVKDLLNVKGTEVLIEHHSFRQMHDMILKQCPENFRCVEPIALFHEALWHSGLRRSTGNERGLYREDRLRHAIEEGEYGYLFETKERDEARCKEVWVDVIRRKDDYDMNADLIDDELTSSDRRSPVRPAVR